MQDDQTLFTQDLYLKQLSTINSVYFTKREIDVISCILSARRTSKIASFLSIDTRTVETHIRNIMAKIERNSQESIIDFIEVSDALPFLRKYYPLLRIEAAFKKTLKDIAKLIQTKSSLGLLVQGESEGSFVNHLKSHLEFVGIELLTTARKKAEYLVFVIPNALSEEDISLFLQKAKQNPNKILFLLQERKNNKEIPNELMKLEIVDFSKQENYYFSFFLILEKLLPTLSFDKFITEFKDKYEKIDKIPNLAEVPSNKIPLTIWRMTQLKLNFILTLLVILAISCGFSALLWNQKNNGDVTRSDLVLPKKSVLLNRPELIAQIDEKLKKQNEILAIALVGPGGAGKTTMARQYAYQQKTDCLWEINAETHESLNVSFANLAQNLAKTQEDQKSLKEIQEIKSSKEKEERVIQFVKERLKSKGNWLLIYDNVETFGNIEKYFPHDSKTWGQGRIILTTRDSNIDNNRYINHVILIGELNADQKHTLFTKIMEDGAMPPLRRDKDEKTKDFLEQIPPFPLDISIVAYYLKTTKTSYSTYLKNIAEYDSAFSNFQETLLKEVGKYTKTRHSIITLSLQRIISTHKDFKDLLLFISMLDSQNIPKELLSHFKNDIVVADFIFNLRKYSLLTSRSPDENLSIHRSTQSISLAYLTKTLDLRKGHSNSTIETLTASLENYLNGLINKEDLPRMIILANHCNAFLTHTNILTANMEGTIEGLLGIFHYFYSDDTKAKTLLEESLLKLNKSSKENQTRIAQILGYLGNVYRDLGNYNQSKAFLEKSLSIYKKHTPTDNFKYAYFLAYLGIIERILGNYEVARPLFERGLILHKKYFPKNENYLAWVSGQLGILDEEVGYYEKAKIALEASLVLLNKERAVEHFDIAWALEHLGSIYTKLGNYKKSKDALEQSLNTYSLYFSDKIGRSWILSLLDSQNTAAQHEKSKNLFNKIVEAYKTHLHGQYIYVAFPLRQLGNLYGKLGNSEKAKFLLEQSLLIYQKNYGNDHLEAGLILNDLGEIYLLEENLKASESFIQKSLIILEKEKHPKKYICLENLSLLYMKKITLTAGKEKNQNVETLRKKAIFYLNQALKTVKSHFPKECIHEKRLQDKLEKLQEPNISVKATI